MTQCNRTRDLRVFFLSQGARECLGYFFCKISERDS